MLKVEITIGEYTFQFRDAETALEAAGCCEGIAIFLRAHGNVEGAAREFNASLRKAPWALAKAEKNGRN